MTGFEYAAGIGMLYEGMEEQGLEVIRNIRARYNGSRRNPFDEAECGHHYARAMASWSSILALSGFHYSGVDRRIKFTDKPGSYFWSNGSAWGELVIQEKEGHREAEFHVLSGEIQLERFQIGAEEEVVFERPMRLAENEHVILSFSDN